MKLFYLQRPMLIVSAHNLILSLLALTVPVVVSPAFAGDNPTSTELTRVAYDLEIVDGILVLDGKKTEATLANVVDALRTRYQDANIAVAPGLGKLKISDLKLRAGQLTDELEAVRVASGNKFDIKGPGGVSVVDPNTGRPLNESSNSGLFVLQGPSATEQSERNVEAFNIEPYLSSLRRSGPASESPQDRSVREQQSIDELTMIVGETIEMMKNETQTPERPVFRFHRGANLLVVIGSRDSVEVARKIVNALPGMATPPRAESNEARNAAMDAFRKRYGLDRGSQEPAAAPQQAPAQK